MTGATALVGPSATDELATITAVASGARASIDKRLFFDRTLPAVIASMDAERAAIKADIARMRTLPVEQYDLASAMNDVNRLQQAGRLDQAVARMTQVAQTDRVAEEQRLHNIVAACDASTAGAAELNEKFRHLMMDDLSKSASRLSLAAKELNITIPVGAVPSWRMVAPAFDAQFCDDDKKEQFINRMETLIAAL
ncbi:hypothetical protein WBP07_11450 [Novosphingobium sp. BL-8A]|uniref:hypothetical protein n=1 Tax=Novosphingobium sp. BL-8A TaxID=3127639 RepID=UPI003756CAE6